MPQYDSIAILEALRQRPRDLSTERYEVSLADLQEFTGLAEAAAAAMADAGEPPGAVNESPRAPAPERLKDHLQNLEIEQMKKAMQEAEGNQSAAARTLHMKRSTLLSKMKKHGL